MFQNSIFYERADENALSKVRKKMGRVWGGPSLLFDLNLLATKIISQILLRVENGCIGEHLLATKLILAPDSKSKST